MEITEQDKLNNPGVSLEEIAKVKSQYHFHRISSVSLSQHSLICTFQIDDDPTSLFYTPEENGKEPVRKYKIETEDKTPQIAPDALSVNVGEQLISAEEIWGVDELIESCSFFPT